MAEKPIETRTSISSLGEDEVIETRVCTTWVRADGILHTVIKPNAVVDLEAAQEIWDAHEALLGSQDKISFVDIRGINKASREARELLGAQSQKKQPLAIALLIGSPISRVIGNFFLGLNRPPCPTKLFTSESEALAWLKGFVR